MDHPKFFEKGRYFIYYLYNLRKIGSSFNSMNSEYLPFSKIFGWSMSWRGRLLQREVYQIAWWFLTLNISPCQKYFKHQLQLRYTYHMILDQNGWKFFLSIHFGVGSCGRYNVIAANTMVGANIHCTYLQVSNTP